MKFSSFGLLAAAAPAAATTADADRPIPDKPIYIPPPLCTPATVSPALDSVGIKATLVGTVPTTSTALGHYNMQPVEGFADHILFVDQANGKIFSFNPATKATTKIYDVLDYYIPGVFLAHDMPYIPTANQHYQIQSVAPGPDAGSVLVVVTSRTLPDGTAAPDVALPTNNPSFRMFEDPTDCDLNNIEPTCAHRGYPYVLYNETVTPALNGMFLGPRCCLAAKVSAPRAGGPCAATVLWLSSLQCGRVIYKFRHLEIRCLAVALVVVALRGGRPRGIVNFTKGKNRPLLSRLLSDPRSQQPSASPRPTSSSTSSTSRPTAPRSRTPPSFFPSNSRSPTATRAEGWSRSPTGTAPTRARPSSRWATASPSASTAWRRPRSWITRAARSSSWTRPSRAPGTSSPRACATANR